MSRKRQGGGKRRAVRGDEEPTRTCVSCRALSPKDEALRFVRAPDGAVHLDVRGRLPGRGATTCASKECVQKAVDKGGFARAFEAAVIAGPALVAAVEDALQEAALGSLGLARRQGQLVAGRDEARRALEAGTATVVIVARDLSERSHDELRPDLLDKEVVPGPEKDRIGAALGRPTTGVVALTEGAAARRALLDVARWARVAGLLAAPQFKAYKPDPRRQDRVSA